MSTHNEHSAEHIENPDVLHESSDVNVRGIFGFGIGLAVGTALVSLLLFGAFSIMVQRFDTQAPNASPLTKNRPVVPESQQHAERTFPEPRLQVNNVEDLKKFREQEHLQLQSYGWVDQNAGVAHIPIDRAMELTLERGLPVRTPGAVPPAAPSLAPPASTSGVAAPTAAEVSRQAQQPLAQQPPPLQQQRKQPKQSRQRKAR